MTTTRMRPTAAPAMEQLPTPTLRTSREIQGNVLAAFNKDYMAFRYMRFPEDKAKGRGWLSVILNSVSVTADVEDFNEEFSLARRAYGHDPAKQATWVGVSLTFPGLLSVAADSEQVLREDLKNFPQLLNGAAASAAKLSDTGASDPKNWLFGSPSTMVHAVLLVASDSPEALEAKLQNIKAADEAHDMTLVHQDDGQTLPGKLKGHEHFGYKDGISQPGVKEFHREEPTKPGFRENRPGAKLIEPGEFVFGYKTEPNSKNRTGPAWMKNGSLQVVRRMSQDVQGWRDAVAKQAAKFVPELDATQLGACLVGRHLDGTPLATPTDRLKGLGGDANDFDYADDADGGQTPCAAHIRRTNPRKASPNIPVDSNRIMRRGIPYGPVLEDDPKADRGLMFVCYGTSFEEQFEFVQAIWSNNPRFTPGETGAPNCIDKVTGPDGGGEIALDPPRGPKATISMAQCVTTKGSLYAFTPSITTLRHLAAGSPLPRG
ncbi:peroxidase [Streptomyces nigrescens]|uniref:Peroxidase n=2 Tax=Streptomyces TaxID=1883 RepID=A0ABN6QX29_STRNI|nr:Dyp-type peroxidase [Streptomyces nigrescens]MEE4417891.1 Dyp-type peroxidase [Streptomyces sp. DSM 41528]BDM69780.1 peroxidase [Streptomyces nigrescens]